MFLKIESVHADNISSHEAPVKQLTRINELSVCENVPVCQLPVRCSQSACTYKHPLVSFRHCLSSMAGSAVNLAFGGCVENGVNIQFCTALLWDPSSLPSLYQPVSGSLSHLGSPFAIHALPPARLPGCMGPQSVKKSQQPPVRGLCSNSRVPVRFLRLPQQRRK